MYVKFLKIIAILTLIIIFSDNAFAIENNNSQATDAINNFAFKTADLLNSDEDFFFSPFSIVTAFGMVYAGAKNETAIEIQNALNLTPEIHENLGSLVNDLTGKSFYSANKVWLNNDLKLLETYNNILKKYYSSEAALVDFDTKTNETKNIINDWVSKNTRNKINNLIQKIQPDTRMILTNAVYFNAKWRNAFDKNKTRKRPFKKFPDDTSNFEVDMMSKLDNFSYGETDGSKIIKIPYDTGKSFIAVLPPENWDNNFLKNINQELFSKWLKSLKRQKVDLWLPKFKNEKRYNLNGIFKQLGVKIAFSNSADFSGIATKQNKIEPLKISEIIHQSFIEIDEEKTEAAAATAVTMMRVTSAKLPKIIIKEFHADRPFIYFIIDDDTNTILFMGKQTFK